MTTRACTRRVSAPACYPGPSSFEPASITLRAIL
jgi:hypothetical protein